MIATDPNATVDVRLDGYAHLPADQQPVFVCRHLTARQHVRFVALGSAALAAVLDEVPEGMSAPDRIELTSAAADKCIDLLEQALALVIVGQRNVPPGALGEVLTIEELWALRRNYAAATSLSDADEKKSGSPSGNASNPSGSDQAA